MIGAITPLPHWLHGVYKERFFLYYEKLRFTIIQIPLKEIVKTGRTARNEDFFKVRWWERMVNCSSALWTVWSTLLTYPLREVVKEPSDIFLGANVMKFSCEKPHGDIQGSDTPDMGGSMVDPWHSLQMSTFVLRWKRNRNGAAETAQSHIYPAGLAPLDLWGMKTEKAEYKDSLRDVSRIDGLFDVAAIGPVAQDTVRNYPRT